MVEQGFDKTTVQVDIVTAHDTDAFPEIELVEYNGFSVRAYADRTDSLYELFASAAKDVPERTVLSFPEYGYDVTYEELAERVNKLATGLESAGFEQGTRLAILLSNRPEFVELVLACARIGIAVVPMNTDFETKNIAYLLNDTEPEIVVTETKHIEKVREAGVANVTDATYVVDAEQSDGRSFDELREDGNPVAEIPPETATAMLLYTSGTTGRPKGCVLENFHVVNGVKNNAFSFGFTDGTRSFVPTPLFHVSGLISGLLSVFAVAGSVVVRDSFSPESFLRTIEKYNVNYIMGVPTNYILTVETASPVDYDLSSLETCAYGSAPMPSDMIHKIREAFPDVNLSNTYGKTETVSGLASMCPDQYTSEHPETVGLPTPAIEYKVVDEDGTELQPGEVGELAVKGGIVISEYWNRRDANRAAFEDGWHLTGDVGVVDDEGFITLKGRDTDMIIRGGKNIYPLEIEESLARQDSVLESSVTGFDDKVLGERVLAAIVPKPGEQVTEEMLRSHCERELAEYKVPEVFRIVSKLPRNPNGKVEKEKLLPEPLRHGIAASD